MRNNRGFTIVELLIVIVVIAILAAISIVAYNGVQERARASSVSSAVVSIQKAFTLWAIEEGYSTWPIPSGNPSLDTLASTTSIKNYLQKSPTIDGVTNWIYDNDDDSRSGCTLSTSGVNVFASGVSQSIAQRVDESIDDGALNCGTVRYTNGGSLFISIDEDQIVGN